MRKTQDILYRIGKIVSFVLLGIFALVVLVNIGVLIYDAVNDFYIVDQISAIITNTIFAGLVVALIILASKYTEDALKAPVDVLTPIILLMVFGFLSGNWLYLVGGVFGIIGASQEKNGQEGGSEE